MKKFLSILLLSIILSGCGKQERYENGVPTYFIEPSGYVIAEIKCNEFSNYYGYISVTDYNAFLTGDLNGSLTVLHPYEKGNSIIVNSDSIIAIKTGVYKDIRHNK